MKNLPRLLCGGISAGEWPKFNPKKFALDFYNTRCNNMVLEAMAPCYDPNSSTGYNNKGLDQIYIELIKFIDPILKLDLWVTLHLTNGNDQEIWQMFGADNIFHKILIPLKNKYGTNSRLIICPVAEEHGGAQERRLIDLCLGNWNNHLMYNGSGRPQSLPDKRYTVLDYHTQSANDIGPRNIYRIMDTDNGPMINYLRYGAPSGCYWNPERVTMFSYSCKANGSGLNLYAVDPITDWKSLEIVGKVFGVRSKVSFIDKIIAYLKLL